MVEYNMWKQPIGGKKRKKEINLFSSSFAFGIKPPKKQKNPSGGGIGFGPLQEKETKRDPRRTFTQTQKKEILYQQDNKCARAECHHKKLDPRDIEFHHKKPWASGGKTVTVNGRALCGSCHKIVTHELKLKEVDKKRKPKQDNHPFGQNIFKPPKHSKNNHLFYIIK